MIHDNRRRVGSAQTQSRIRGGFVARTLGVLLTASLVACGAPRLEPDTPGGVDLAGQWRLNRQASEDPRALIAKLQEKVAKQLRHSRDDELYGDDPVGEQGSGGGPGRGGYGRSGQSDGARGENRGSRDGAGEQGAGQNVPDGGWRSLTNPHTFLRVRYDAALGSRLSGESVTIEQSPDRFSITRGDSRRSYTPGAHSVVSVADGVADQTSGWKGREYVIDVNPQVGPHLVERYGLSADGQLIEKVSLNESGLPKLEFTRVYERGVAPPRDLPTSN